MEWAELLGGPLCGYKVPLPSSLNYEKKVWGNDLENFYAVYVLYQPECPIHRMPVFRFSEINSHPSRGLK